MVAFLVVLLTMKLTQKISKAHDDSIWSVSCTESFIVTGSLDETVRVWTLNDEHESKEQPNARFESHRLAVVSVDTIQNEYFNVAVSSSMDGSTRIYDLNTLAEIASVDVGSLKQWTVSHHANRKLFVTGTHSGHVNFVDYSAEAPVQNAVEVSPGSFLMCAKFDSQGRVAGSGSWDGSMAIIDVESAKVSSKMANGHHKAVRSIDFTADGSRMITGSEDHYVGVFDVRSADQVTSVSVHSGWVLGVRASPADSNLLATCSTDGSVKLLDARKNYQVIGEISKAHAGHVWGISFAGQGSTLVSVGEDSALQLYSL